MPVSECEYISVKVTVHVSGGRCVRVREDRCMQLLVSECECMY